MVRKVGSRGPPQKRSGTQGSLASRRQFNSVGAAKRLEAKSKKGSALDVYEYAPQKTRRSKIELQIDRSEEIGGRDDNDDEERDRRIPAIVDGEDMEVRSEDDEEIDSDEAFEGESDEDRFAHFNFPKSSSLKSKSKVAPIARHTSVPRSKLVDLNESDTRDIDEGPPSSDSVVYKDDDEDDESEGGSDMMDLSRMLEEDGEDSADDHEGETIMGGDLLRLPTVVQSDDEENGEEDEREDVGHAVDEQDEEGDADDLDDDDEGDITKLGDFIQSLSQRKRKLDETDEPDNKPRRTKRRLLNERTEIGPENEFAVPSGPRQGKKLQLDQLLAPLSTDASATDYVALKKATKPLTSSSKNGPLPVPLPYRAQERLDRQAAYDQTKGEVQKWAPTMRRIRDAEHLSFPLQAEPTHSTSNADLTAKFKPVTEMESAVDRLLKEANLREEDIEKTEELAMNHLSVEEVAARRAELRQMRELMFRAEMKAKRIAKIKSKTYHRIQKKRREKDKAALDTLGLLESEHLENERNALEVDRARERATMRHKNTGKWAKSVLSRGELDIDQRREINEQLQRGEQLRRKILGKGDDSEVEDDDDDDDEEDRSLDRIKASAFDELQLVDEESAAKEQSSSSHKGLLQMKFMQTARAEGVREADRLRDDFKGELAKLGLDGTTEEEEPVEERPAFITVEGNAGRRIFGPGGVQPGTSAEDTVPTEAGPSFMPMESRAATKVDSARDQTTTTGGNPWLISQSSASRLSKKKNSVVVNKDSSFADKSANVLRQHLNKTEAKRQQDKADAQLEISVEDVLKVDAAREAATPKKTAVQGPKPSAASKQTQAVDSAYHDSDSEGEPINEMSAFSQRDLVAQAFAGDNVIEDFEEEKRREVEKDAPREEDVTLPGWGSWGGKGTREPKRKFTKQVPGVLPTQRADTGKSNVIITERKDKKGAKYQVKDLPWPYTSKAQFEKAVDMPLGAEWNTQTMHQRLTVPRVVKKMGKVIDPLEKLF